MFSKCIFFLHSKYVGYTKMMKCLSYPNHPPLRFAQTKYGCNYRNQSYAFIEHSYQSHLPCEKEFFALLTKHYGNNFKCLGRYAPFDFVCVNNQICIEFKRRHFNHDIYNTYFIGRDKLDYYFEMIEKDENKRFYFVNQFDDCLLIYKFKQKDLKEFERSVWKEQLIYRIPRNLFKTFDKVKSL
jgi:hypothetical protein